MKTTRKLIIATAILMSTVVTSQPQVKAASESTLALKNLQDMRKEWGPFVGPWKRYDKNPIIGLEDKETYSIQNGPQSVIRFNGKWYMFLMTSQPMVCFHVCHLSFILAHNGCSVHFGPVSAPVVSMVRFLITWPLLSPIC